MLLSVRMVATSDEGGMEEEEVFQEAGKRKQHPKAWGPEEQGTFRASHAGSRGQAWEMGEAS